MSKVPSWKEWEDIFRALDCEEPMTDGLKQVLRDARWEWDKLSSLLDNYRAVLRNELSR